LSRLSRPAQTNRIVASRLLPSLPRCGKVLNASPARFDSTSAANYELFKKQMDDANKDALKVRDEGVVGQFGWVPFYGMVGVIALSKEIVVCGTEFMLASAFGVWAFCAYIGVGEIATKSMTEMLADQKTMFDRVSDYQIEKMKVYKAKTQVDVDAVPVLKEMLAQQREVQKAYITAQNIEQRHALRQAIVDKLSQIKVREDAEASLERSRLVDAAVAGVYNAFETDEGPLKEAALANAISLLGTDGMTTLEADPVKKLFVKAFN